MNGLKRVPSIGRGQRDVSSVIKRDMYDGT